MTIDSITNNFTILIGTMCYPDVKRKQVMYYLCYVCLNESISLSSSKSYMRGEIGYVTEVNLVRK